MTISVIFLISGNQLSRKEKSLIASTIKKHTRKAARALRYHPKVFTYTIYENYPRTDREGMPGFTQARDWVWLAINPKQLHSQRRAKMLERLAYTSYHEMHHAARGYVGFLPGREEHTLMGCIVSEGLADAFALEQYPTAYTRLKNTYNKRQVIAWLAKIKKLNLEWSSDYSPSWIWGGHGKPKSLAYRIGNYVIGQVKKDNPRTNAVKLLRVPSKKIFKMSGLK